MEKPIEPMTLSEAARRYAIPRSTLRSRVLVRTLRAWRQGRRILVDARDVEDALKVVPLDS